MEPQFWHERWQRRETGFHQEAVHADLQEHWPAVGNLPGALVFAPLCGKSLDLAWLVARGHRVLGVELSMIAAEEYFASQQLVPARRQEGPFTRLEAGSCTILVGDCFALEPAQLAGCTALYDRAALIALPGAMRERYAAQLARLLPAGTRGLLITVDYPPADMPGPPFPVPAAEVQRLHGAAFEVTGLARRDALADEPRLAARGLTSLHEASWLLVRRG
jgi:thiopurine S-methyltransferase